MTSRAEKKAIRELTDTFADIMRYNGMSLSDKELRLLKKEEIKRYEQLKEERVPNGSSDPPGVFVPVQPKEESK